MKYINFFCSCSYTEYLDTEEWSCFHGLQNFMTEIFKAIQIMTGIILNYIICPPNILLFSLLLFYCLFELYPLARLIFKQSFPAALFYLAAFCTFSSQINYISYQFQPIYPSILRFIQRVPIILSKHLSNLPRTTSSKTL